MGSRRVFHTRSVKRVNRNPLRRIIREEPRCIGLHPDDDVGIAVVVEVLECGHEVRKKSDLFGPTNAYRRRCKRCGKEAPRG